MLDLHSYCCLSMRKEENKIIYKPNRVLNRLVSLAHIFMILDCVRCKRCVNTHRTAPHHTIWSIHRIQHHWSGHNFINLFGWLFSLSSHFINNSVFCLLLFLHFQSNTLWIHPKQMFRRSCNRNALFFIFIDLKWIFCYTQLTRFIIRYFFCVRFYRTFLLRTIKWYVCCWPSKNKIIWICMRFFLYYSQQNGIDKFHLNHSSKSNRFLFDHLNEMEYCELHDSFALCASASASACPTKSFITRIQLIMCSIVNNTLQRGLINVL